MGANGLLPEYGNLSKDRLLDYLIHDPKSIKDPTELQFRPCRHFSSFFLASGSKECESSRVDVFLLDRCFR